LEDIDLLRYYADEWYRYTRGANYLNRLFTYLNRYWVKRERDEGKKGVYQVYTVRPLRVRCHTWKSDQQSLSLACARAMEGPLLHAHPEG
jgi:Cullin, a subunit of E3 ubiquitin ligase